MAGKWDSTLKQLIKINPQHFVSWLLEGAQYVGELSPHLNRSIDMDALHKVMIHGAPFIQPHPNGSDVHRFYFTNVKLWEVPKEVFTQVELVALLPLVPLTRNGASHEAIEEAIADIEHLVEDEIVRTDLVSLTLTLASLAFIGKKEEQDWLLRRFRMQHDLLHDTPIYQLILEEGREEAFEQARQERLQEQRTTIQRIVQTKFPQIARLAIERTEVMTDSKKLQDLIVFMSIAQTEADARQYLNDVNKQDTNG